MQNFEIFKNYPIFFSFYGQKPKAIVYRSVKLFLFYPISGINNWILKFLHEND